MLRNVHDKGGRDPGTERGADDPKLGGTVVSLWFEISRTGTGRPLSGADIRCL